MQRGNEMAANNKPNKRRNKPRKPPRKLRPPPGERCCPSCRRNFCSGLHVTWPLCPPCWLEAEKRQRPPPPLPVYFQPVTWEDHLYESWFDYYSLLLECYNLPAAKGGVRFSALSEAEQRWFAVGFMDGVAREQGFAIYFKHALQRPLDGLVVPGLLSVNAVAQVDLYKEARAVFLGLEQAVIDHITGLDYPEMDGPFGMLDCEYFDLEPLGEVVAQAAYADGMLKPPQTRATSADQG